MAVMILAAALDAGAAPATAGGWVRGADPGRGWVCNAYGRGGNQRTVWQTVSGSRSSSQAAAKSDAMNECRRRLNGCQPSGCWQG